MKPSNQFFIPLKQIPRHQKLSIHESAAHLGIDLCQTPHFTCLEDTFITEDGRAIRTYGIAVHCYTKLPPPTDTLIFHYSNLTTEKEKLVKLIQLMHQEQLQLIHVEDVIEDSLL